MDVQMQETGACARKLSVTITADEVNRAFDSVLKEYSKKARIPGFRPGKAPKTVLEAHYGGEVREEVQARLVGKTLYEAISEKKATPVAMPRIEAGTIKKNDAFTYTAEFDVSPEVELAEYKGLAAPTFEVELADGDVDAYLDGLRKQSSQLAPVLDRDIAQEGDVVMLDYVGTMGGIPFEGGAAQNAMVEVGGEGYIPGFADGLMGAKVPGQRQIEVDFPADYASEELAGKPATFRMELKELKKKDIPDLDDDFAKDLGYEGLEELRTKVAAGQREQKEAEAKSKQREAVLKALVEKNPFEVPTSMVKERADRMVADAAAQVEQMSGQKIELKPDAIESLRADSQQRADFQVRSGLLLLKIAEAESIEVTDSDIDAEVNTVAESAGDQAERVRGVYANPEQRQRMKYRLLEDKTISFLLEHADAEGAQAKPDAGGAEPEPDAPGDGDKGEETTE